MKNLSKLLISVLILFIGSSVVFGGKIWLEPAEGELISQCPGEINIMIDTEGVETNTVGVSFYIDDTVFALNELDTAGGIFPAYTSFVRGKAWHGDRKGEETISFMGTTARKDGFKGKGKLVTLKVIPLLGVKSFDIEFYNIPGFSADDSNINHIVDGQVFDALNDAIGGRYTVVDGECPMYESPIVISESDTVVLVGKDKKSFLDNNLGLKRAITWLGNNIHYIIIISLVLFILFVILRKKDKKESVKKNKK